MKHACLVLAGLLCAGSLRATPVITGQPNPLTSSVSFGASLTNRVNASSGNPPLSFQWRLGDFDIPAATNKALILTNVSASDAGLYTVLVTDGTGSVASKGWRVEVDATFTKVSSGPVIAVSGVGAAWGDFDRDGWPDLFVGTTTNNPTQNSPNHLYHNERDGTFAVVDPSVFPPGSGVISAGFVDFDNDGWLDVYGSKIGADILYRNNGDGTFSKTVSSVTTDAGSGVGSAWADFDNDGLVDLFVANEGSSNALFRNNGNGSFTKMTNPILNLNVSSQAAAWADYDNDGLPDLFVANYQNNKNLLYHNEGGGQFRKVTTGPIPTEVGRFGACAWGDYDNDGFFDLLAGSYGPNNCLYHNNGDGTFSKVLKDIVATDPVHCDSLAWGDYDNDGWLDLLASGEGYGLTT